MEFILKKLFDFYEKNNYIVLCIPSERNTFKFLFLNKEPNSIHGLSTYQKYPNYHFYLKPENISHYTIPDSKYFYHIYKTKNPLLYSPERPSLRFTDFILDYFETHSEQERQDFFKKNYFQLFFPDAPENLLTNFFFSTWNEHSNHKHVPIHRLLYQSYKEKFLEYILLIPTSDYHLKTADFSLFNQFLTSNYTHDTIFQFYQKFLKTLKTKSTNSSLLSFLSTNFSTEEQHILSKNFSPLAQSLQNLENISPTILGEQFMPKNKQFAAHISTKDLKKTYPLNGWQNGLPYCQFLKELFETTLHQIIDIYPKSLKTVYSASDNKNYPDLILIFQYSGLDFTHQKLFELIKESFEYLSTLKPEEQLKTSSENKTFENISILLQSKKLKSELPLSTPKSYSSKKL